VASLASLQLLIAPHAVLQVQAEKAASDHLVDKKVALPVMLPVPKASRLDAGGDATVRVAVAIAT